MERIDDWNIDENFIFKPTFHNFPRNVELRCPITGVKNQKVTPSDGMLLEHPKQHWAATSRGKTCNQAIAKGIFPQPHNILHKEEEEEEKENRKMEAVG